jgi:plastocyanin
MLLAAAACGGDGAAASPTSTAGATEPDQRDVAFADLTGEDEVVIQVRDNSFVGQHVTVSAGTTVTFDNRGRNPHNAVPVESGAFAEVATESLQPGQSATVAFDAPGEYAYYCTLHGTETAGMVGTIRVVD